MRAKIGIMALLFSLLFASVVGIPLSAGSSGPVDVSVIPSPVPAGQSFDVHFKVNYAFQDKAGATVEVGTCSGCSDVWKNGPYEVYFGQSYDVHPPGISTPGSYIATVVVIIPGALGGSAVGGSANFHVVGSVTQTQVVSSTSQATTQAHTVSSTTVEAPFDFAISVSPTEQTVNAGQSAAYVVIVDLISGAPASVRLSIKNSPAGISAAFDPKTAKPPYNSLLTLSTTQSVTPGQVEMTITGVGGGKTRTANFTLIVSTGQSETQTASPENSTQTSSNWVLQFIQQNSLIIVGGVIIVALAAAVIVWRGRSSRQISTPGVASPTAVKADMYCRKCGAKVPRDSGYCLECGARLD